MKPAKLWRKLDIVSDILHVCSARKRAGVASTLALFVGGSGGLSNYPQPGEFKSLPWAIPGACNCVGYVPHHYLKDNVISVLGDVRIDILGEEVLRIIERKFVTVGLITSSTGYS